jgi:hypothetical protein
MEFAVKKRQERFLAGLCERCGGERAPNSARRCLACLDAQRVQYRQKREAKRQPFTENRHSDAEVEARALTLAAIGRDPDPYAPWPVSTVCHAHLDQLGAMTFEEIGWVLGTGYERMRQVFEGAIEWLRGDQCVNRARGRLWAALHAAKVATERGESQDVQRRLWWAVEEATTDVEAVELWQGAVDVLRSAEDRDSDNLYAMSFSEPGWVRGDMGALSIEARPDESEAA